MRPRFGVSTSRGNKILISVRGGYQFKEQLKRRGFRFNRFNKTWDKEYTDPDSVREDIEFLLGLGLESWPIMATEEDKERVLKKVEAFFKLKELLHDKQLVAFARPGAILVRNAGRETLEMLRAHGFKAKVDHGYTIAVLVDEG